MSGSNPVGLTRGEQRQEWGAAPPQNAPVAKDTKLCVACNRYHGGVNAELWCLRTEVTRQRELLAKLGQR